MQTEKDTDRSSQFKEALKTYKLEDDMVELIAMIPNLDVKAVEAVCWIASVVGFNTVSDFFFAMREYFRMLKDAQSQRKQAEFFIGRSLRLYDEITETIIDLRQIKREDVTQDMLRPGQLRAEFVHMDREAYLAMLQNEYKDQLSGTPQKTEQKILSELFAVKDNPRVPMADFAALLHLLGIESLAENQIHLEPSLQSDENRDQLMPRLLEIGGGLSRSWQHNIWINPMFDPELYQRLETVGFQGESSSEEFMMLGEMLNLNDLLSLINGPSAVGERYGILARVFLDKLAAEDSIQRELAVARLQIEKLLASDPVPKDTIYQILLTLLTDSR